MYLVKKISFDEAEKIWRESPNSCIYNSPKFLKNFKNIHFYCAFKGLDPMMCWPIFLNDKTTRAIEKSFPCNQWCQLDVLSCRCC